MGDITPGDPTVNARSTVAVAIGETVLVTTTRYDVPPDEVFGSTDLDYGQALKAAAQVRRHVADPAARAEILEALGLTPTRRHHPAATAPRRGDHGRYV